MDGLTSKNQDEVYLGVIIQFTWTNRSILVLYSYITSHRDLVTGAFFFLMAVFFGLLFMETQHHFGEFLPTRSMGEGMGRVSKVLPGPLPQCTLPKTRTGYPTCDNHYVQFCKSVSSFKFVHQFTDQGKRICILDGVFIEISIILAGSESWVLFANKEEWRCHRGL